jgi:hypothetical protein
MLKPVLRRKDDAGHQIVRVVLRDSKTEYPCAWAGVGALCVGDAVTVEDPGYVRGTVVGLGSDWAEPFTLIAGTRRR